MTVQGMMQQSHSKSPQSHGMQGLVGPLIGLEILEMDDVEGGMLNYFGLLRHVSKTSEDSSSLLTAGIGLQRTD